jgi:hypothetical protein
VDAGEDGTSVYVFDGNVLAYEMTFTNLTPRGVLETAIIEALETDLG